MDEYDGFWVDRYELWDRFGDYWGDGEGDGEGNAVGAGWGSGYEDRWVKGGGVSYPVRRYREDV